MAFAPPLTARAETGLPRRIAALAARGGEVPTLLWVPVAMGMGILAYFAPAAEPAWWVGGTVALSALAVALLLRALPLPRLAFLLLGAAGIGFACAQLRTATAPPLAEVPPRAVIVIATVEAVEALPEGRRALLGSVTLGDAQFPRDVRVRLHATDGAALAPGDRVRVRALLRPPSPPAAPGGFDFQRTAFFSGLGATGIALGPVEVIGRAAENRLGRTLTSLRQAVLSRVHGAVPGPEGAIAGALLTGQRAAIPQADLAAMREAGLAHLLAVSGLHVGIVGGVVFAALRLLFALTGAALHVNAKKLAALGGILAAVLYMLLTGSQVPMQRAVAMAALLALAVLLDRQGAGMRALALAAIIVLAFQPEALLGPSFQMSFAAVLGLIAAYHAGKPWLTRVHAARGWPLRLAAGLALVVFTSLVASAATTPFVAWHFQRVPLYGIAANALAVPLTTIAVMPLGLIGLALMPVGLEALALVPMGWAVEVILWAAREVASWPGAAPLVPAAPAWGVFAAAAGLVMLCLVRGRVALLGLLPLALGMASPWMTAQPDVIVNPTARVIALKGPLGYAALAMPGASRFEREAIAARLGLAELPPLPAADAGPLSCTRAACTLAGPAGQTILLLRPGPEVTYCHGAALVVSPEPLRGRCRPAQTIDRFSVWRDGAHAAWFSAAGVRVVSDRSVRGDRPWVAPVPTPRPGRAGNAPMAPALELPATGEH